MSKKQLRKELFSLLRAREPGLDAALEAIKKFHLDATRTLLTKCEQDGLDAFFRAVSLEALGMAEEHQSKDC